MGRFIDFLGNIFSPGKIYNIKDPPEATEEEARMRTTAFAADVAVNMIAGLVGKCEFKTCIKDVDTKKSDWYRWNTQPNSMQSGVEFKQAIVRKLLSEGEVLIIDTIDSLFVAERFEVYQPYLKFPAQYRNVEVMTQSRDLFKFDRSFSESDVYHIRLDNSNVRDMLDGLEVTYNKLLAMSYAKYKRSNGRKGVLEIDKPVSGDEKKKEEQSNSLRRNFSKYYSDENGLAIVPRGMKYTELQGPSNSQSSEISNFSAITRESFTRAAQAYNIPPALLLGEVADTSKAMDQLLTLCIDPLVHLIENAINRKLYSDSIMSGSGLRIDTTTIKHIDIFDVAASADKLIADGILNIDEVREAVGRHPLNTEWSRRHWMTKNYENIETAGNAAGGGGNA